MQRRRHTRLTGGLRWAGKSSKRYELYKNVMRYPGSTTLYLVSQNAVSCRLSVGSCLRSSHDIMPYLGSSRLLKHHTRYDCRYWNGKT